MLLGDLIRKFDDGNAALEALMSLNDLALVTRVEAAARENELPVGEYAARATRRYIDQASDEDWLTLIGQMARVTDPAEYFLRQALAQALAGKFG
ncbi:MAG: hypothetical protein KJZ73_07515 [Pseudorhodoplanes sp.]|nr:hypothetical protein [Pseudorhodoplanes sp.]MBW7950275.1 hypothetical protein [Pseudorhodoplanes sp.]MCL4711080.1 hypothetical protein [Pseudorhodoplanes sp.]MCQ3942240.1 hypothetical protein [Alphaproteobacteria bacterium]GIK82090.1 MAG: hypothetical protein BroJett024_31950 [Alphaproteobacteria bacterium]